MREKSCKKGDVQMLLGWLVFFVRKKPTKKRETWEDAIKNLKSKELERSGFWASTIENKLKPIAQRFFRWKSR